MMKYFWIATFIASAPFAQMEAFCLAQTLGPHSIFLGPEFCHISRTRKGGSEQSGNLIGGHIRYDRIAPCSLYWAVDGYFDTGRVTGKTASGTKIRSMLNEYEIQGRLGYSLYVPKRRELLIIPYATYSYFHGTNTFHSPSPVLYKLHDHMHLGGAGLWVSFCLTERCRFGVDFAAKYIVEGKNKVTDDPDFDSVELEVESEWQYELNVPIEFTVPICGCSFELRFVPFYRFRHLGGKPNYPFDYIETKFNVFGAQLLLFLGF